MSRHWVIHSGCTFHVTFYRSAFTDYQKFTTASTFDPGANSNTHTMGRRNVTLKLRLNGKPVKFLLSNVLHVPVLRYQLISVSAMAEIRIEIRFTDSVISLHRKSYSKIATSGNLTKDLYTLYTTTNTTKPNSAIHETALVSSPQLLRQLLALVNMLAIWSILTREAVQGVTHNYSHHSGECVGCVLGNSHRDTIPKVLESRPMNLLQLVLSDVLGPVAVPSLGAHATLCLLLMTSTNGPSNLRYDGSPSYWDALRS